MEEILLDLHGAVYVGTLCLVLGICIRFFNWTFLIAGYDESTDIPPRIATKMVGNFMLLLSLATILYGVSLMEFQAPNWIGPLFALLVVVAMFRLVYRLNTYELPENRDG